MKIIVNILLPLVLLSAPAAAQRVETSLNVTAREVIPGCRGLAGIAQVANPTDVDIGYCAGAISGIVATDKTLCLPSSILLSEAAVEVVNSWEARPEPRPFVAIATDALRRRWACRQGGPK